MFNTQDLLKELPKDTQKGIRYFFMFLALMVIFTLLSNVASSVTIARVTAVYPVSANISDAVDAAGIVMAKSKETVLSPDDVRIKSVAVGVGDKVESGDELLLFDIEDLDWSIKELDVNLKQMEANAYLLGVSALSNDALEEKQNHEQLNSAKIELDELQKRLQRTVDKADRAYREASQDYSKARREFQASDTSDSDVVSALIKLDKAQTKLDSAKANFDKKKEVYDRLLETSSNPEQVASAKKDLDSAEEAMVSAEKSYQVAFKNYNDAISEAAGSSYDDQQESTYNYEQLKRARDALYDARIALEEAKIDQQEQNTKAKRSIAELELQSEIATANRQNTQQDERVRFLINQADRDSIFLQIEQTEKTLSLMKSIKENGGKLISPVSGTLIKLNVDESRKLYDTDAIQIATQEYGFEVAAKIPSKSAKSLNVNMDVVVTIEDKTVAGNLSNISSYPDDNQQVEITASLPNENWQDGLPAKITVERSKKKYDTCVPLTALRTDSKGDFIYVLEDTQTIMGIQTVLRQVPVEILMSDNSQAAIKGAISHSDKILITSNKMISNNDRVRLVETTEE